MFLIFKIKMVQITEHKKTEIPRTDPHPKSPFYSSFNICETCFTDV